MWVLGSTAQAPPQPVAEPPKLCVPLKAYCFPPFGPPQSLYAKSWNVVGFDVAHALRSTAALVFGLKTHAFCIAVMSLMAQLGSLPSWGGIVKLLQSWTGGVFVMSKPTKTPRQESVPSEAALPATRTPALSSTASQSWTKPEAGLLARQFVPKFLSEAGG